jgi:ribokinase
MADSKQKPNIVVLGGAVMDLHFTVRELPQWKQAVQAHSFHMHPGGKGLNQAVAAARLGAAVCFISSVGEDSFGLNIKQYLEMNRISTEFLRVIKGIETAVTAVIVNEHGEPAFIGSQGMTHNQIQKDQISLAESRIKHSNVMLATFEVSLDVIELAISIAKDNNTHVVLNPAPPLDSLDQPPYGIFPKIDYLVPNMWEATRLLRMPVNDPKELAMALGEMGVKYACITTSEHGCVVAYGGKVLEFKSFFRGQPFDTTGASDAFCAALAIAMCVKEMNLEDAVTLAIAAASISITKRGGAASMPTVEEVNQLLHKRGLSLTL